jgi:hypothetical protein
MTDLQPPDRELAERIRSSMAHYRHHGPLPTGSQRPGGRALRAGGLLAAAAAGAVLTLAAVGILGGMPIIPPTAASVAPSVSPSASGDPSPSHPAGPVSDAAARAACRPVEPADVLDEWRAPGETRADVAARYAQLPLLIADRRQEGSVFVFGDDRLLIGCRYVSGQATPETIMRGMRLAEPGRVRPLFVASDPLLVDGDGLPVPGSHADVMAIGLAASEVARVAILLEDGSTVDARVAGGYWLAWWQVPLSGTAIRAYALNDRLLEELAHEFDIIELPEGGVVIEGSAQASANQ